VEDEINSTSARYTMITSGENVSVLDAKGRWFIRHTPSI
jgi:hypothetical protein